MKVFWQNEKLLNVPESGLLLIVHIEKYMPWSICHPIIGDSPWHGGSNINKGFYSSLNRMFIPCYHRLLYTNMSNFNHFGITVKQKWTCHIPTFYYCIALYFVTYSLVWTYEQGSRFSMISSLPISFIKVLFSMWCWTLDLLPTNNKSAAGEFLKHFTKNMKNITKWKNIY